MKKVQQILCGFAILSTILLNNGCSTITPKPTVGVPIEVSYQYISCGTPTPVVLVDEIASQHAGSKANQEIYTKNIIMLRDSYKQLLGIISCYESQIAKQEKKEKGVE